MTILAAVSALILSTAPDATVAVQTPQAAPAPAARPAAPAPQQALGVAPQAAIDWMKAQGMTVGDLRQDEGRSFVQVQANGLSWLVFFQSCDAGGLCSDIQLTTAVSTAAVTPDLVNGWNRDRRFLKAVYEAEGTGEPTAVVQYDVLLNLTGGEQLADPFAIWLNLLPEFARLMTGAAAAPAAPAAQ